MFNPLRKLNTFRSEKFHENDTDKRIMVYLKNLRGDVNHEKLYRALILIFLKMT